MSDQSRRPRRPRSSPYVLDCLNPDAAGIDCGATTHVIAVPPDRDAAPVQSFRTFTTDLHRLADWLVTCRVTSVALESTGVYWIPVYDILEARGIAVHLVNARHVRNVPGRKSDVSDAEWLRDLHSVGLLRGSFRPTKALAALRAYIRHRHTLVELAAMHIQRMQKALMQMNLQLPSVLSDITGQTGLRIIRAIVAGERDPVQLAAHRHGRCRASEAEIIAALTGHYRPEHLFALEQNLALFDACQVQMEACDRAIEAHVHTLACLCCLTQCPPSGRRMVRQQPAERSAGPSRWNLPSAEVGGHTTVACLFPVYIQQSTQGSPSRMGVHVSKPWLAASKCFGEKTRLSRRPSACTETPVPEPSCLNQTCGRWS